MIRFGSRGSDLALTQTRMVAKALTQATNEEVEIEVIQTRGDLNQSQSLPSIGGKGLFTAELETALREGRIDVAVHSLKDLPVQDPEGICTAAIPTREDPRDVLLFHPTARDPEGGTLPLLPHSRVGTSSPRRLSSLLSLRPDLRCLDIRGNIDTRARKVADRRYEATLLAAAGLNRLGLTTPELERVVLPVSTCTPAPGQGALGIQCRSEDARTRELLARLHDPVSASCVEAERQLLFLLGGGCSMPLGALVEAAAEGYRMRVSLFSPTRARLGLRLDLRAEDPTSLPVEAARLLQPLMDEPLRGHSLVLLRPANGDTDLDKAMGFAGADVEVVPVTEQLSLDPTEADLRSEQTRYLAFTSARAVDLFFEFAAARNLDLDNSHCFAVGPATAAALRARDRECAQPAEPQGGAVLAAFLGTQLPAGSAVLFPCAEQRQPDFETRMRDQGFRVQALPLYRSLALSGVQIPDTDYLIYTSPSAVRACKDIPRPARNPRRIALGPSTAQALQAAGTPADGTADSPTPQALLRLIQRLSDEHPPPPATP